MAIRTFEDIERLKAQEQADNAESSVQSLPPGFIVGFEISISSDYACTIGSGVANVAGERVDLVETALSDSVWQVNRAGGGSGIWYYIYVDRHGVLRVEMVEPEWNSTYYYMGFPGAHFRAIAKIFVNEDDNIMLGSEDLAEEFKEVTVSANGYEDGMFQCDGVADEVQINLAIRYANGQGFNQVTLIGGTFTIDAAITTEDNTHLEFANATVEASSDMTSATMINVSSDDDVIISNGTLTHHSLASVATAYSASIYVTTCNRVMIAGMTFNSSGRNAVQFVSTVDGILSDCNINDCLLHGISVSGNSVKGIRIQNNHINGTLGYGIAVSLGGRNVQIVNNQFRDTSLSAVHTNGAAGTDIVDDLLIEGNTIIDCGYATQYADLEHGIDIDGQYVQTALVSGNHVTDSGTMISYGRCEDSNKPYVDGQSESNAGGDYSTDQAYEGTGSCKITKEVAAGTNGYVRFVDNGNTDDMHGFVAGATYTMGMRVYIPSTGGPDYDEIFLNIRDYYDSAWESTTASPIETYDGWQWVEVERTIRAGATGVIVQVYFATTAANTEYFYIDNVRIYESGLPNYSGCNYNDEGLGTVAKGNSWQIYNMTGDPMGDLYMIPVDERPAAWVLNGESDTSFADVDFSDYVPEGVTALLLKYQIEWTGSGTLDVCAAYIRDKGSSATDVQMLHRMVSRSEDFTSGDEVGHGSQIIVPCDISGFIQYYVNNAALNVFLSIEGYYM